MKMNAEKIGTINEDGLLLLSFAEGSNYFQIQDAEEYDAQDIELGMNQYYIELNDQKNSCYGGIERIEIEVNTLTFTFDDKAKQQIGVDELNINSPQLTDVKSWLLQLVKKHGIPSNFS